MFRRRNRSLPCKYAWVGGLPLEQLPPRLHSEGMNHPLRILIAAWLACLPLLAQMNPAQTNPHHQLQDALILEEHGQFDAAIQVIRPLVESNQFSGVELGRAYIMLGFAYRAQGSFAAAQSAYEQSLRILERDDAHPGDYASALENYAGLYGDLGQAQIAQPMWQKALRLREQTGDHASAALSLLNLAGLDLLRRRVREAKQYLQSASDEMKSASDLVDDDRIALVETRAWLAEAEGYISDAVAGYQSGLELCIRAHGEEYWLTGWEYLLRGRAYSEAGDTTSALADMRKGLAIFDQSLGRRNPRYLWAQIAYSRVLDRAGSHAEARQLRATAEQARKDFYATQCAGCTINVAAFR